MCMQPHLIYLIIFSIILFTIYFHHSIFEMQHGHHFGQLDTVPTHHNMIEDVTSWKLCSLKNINLIQKAKRTHLEDVNWSKVNFLFITLCILIMNILICACVSISFDITNNHMVFRTIRDRWKSSISFLVRATFVKL